MLSLCEAASAVPFDGTARPEGSARPDVAAHGELTVLAMRAKEGTREALESLFELTRDDVVRFIARRVDPAWVDDLTQETFSRALRGLAHYAGRAPVRSWLFSVARHTVADRYRLQGRTPRHSTVDECAETGALAEPGRFDEYLALLDLLDALPEDRRTAFVLTQLQGMPYAEAAEAIGAPIGTVRSRVARGRRDLLRMLRQAA
ncbi:RNA polymerase sigma factor [Nocardiopsis changdeensis]|uniref:Sigma-70 family RNA polymerase sigma factor n=2 Tax=Nocardiopsis TaxID=2013 RepID=A0ABX8BXJ5_9ACTN|nr:sigma-70 family RNA polymerase sigma factor [Nocardiopsis changdeensis]QYX35444.1 sigma-70 family RNA polymerase sigma factor [Nocardiopsis sp. MT53]